MVELMVALVLGLMLVSAVLQTFLSAKRGYELQHDMSRVQENGRFAMEFLKKDIRQADFWGCLTGALGNVTNHVDDSVDPNDLYSMGEGLSGEEGSGYVASLSALSTSFESDKIILRGGSNSGYKVMPPYMPTPAGAVHIESGTGLQQGDIVFLSDCKAGEIFQLTTDPSGGSNETLTHGTGNSVSPGNKSQNFTKSYQGDASVFRAGSTSYEIKIGTSGEPALYRNGTEELVDGIESMQIRYGIDTDNDRIPNYFAPFDASVVDDAVSVQVSLLVRGFRNSVTDDNYGFIYDDQTVTSQDRRLRKVFTSTIALRNRLK